MTGADTIVRHLEQLRVYLNRLAELQQSSREQLHGDWHVQAMVERNLQLAIEAIISISEQIIAALALPTPENSRLALALLADEGIIPRDLAAELQAAVGFRNIIVHQYMGIDYDIVYNALQNDLVHLESFLTIVSTYLRSHDLP